MKKSRLLVSLVFNFASKKREKTSVSRSPPHRNNAIKVIRWSSSSVVLLKPASFRGLSLGSSIIIIRLCAFPSTEETWYRFKAKWWRKNVYKPFASLAATLVKCHAEFSVFIASSLDEYCCRFAFSYSQYWAIFLSNLCQTLGKQRNDLRLGLD